MLEFNTKRLSKPRVRIGPGYRARKNPHYNHGGHVACRINPEVCVAQTGPCEAGGGSATGQRPAVGGESETEFVQSPGTLPSKDRLGITVLKSGMGYSPIWFRRMSATDSGRSIGTLPEFQVIGCVAVQAAMFYDAPQPGCSRPVLPPGSGIEPRRRLEIRWFHARLSDRSHEFSFTLEMCGLQLS